VIAVRFFGGPLHLAVCYCTEIDPEAFQNQSIELVETADGLLPTPVLLPIVPFPVGTDHDTVLRENPVHCLLDKDSMPFLEWYSWSNPNSFQIQHQSTTRFSNRPTPAVVIATMKARLSQMPMSELIDWFANVHAARAMKIVSNLP